MGEANVKDDEEDDQIEEGYTQDYDYGDLRPAGVSESPRLRGLVFISISERSGRGLGYSILTIRDIRVKGGEILSMTIWNVRVIEFQFQRRMIRGLHVILEY